MANDPLSSLPPELQERIKKLPLMNGRTKVAEIAAEAAKGNSGETETLKAEITKITKERDDAQTVAADVTSKFEQFSKDAEKQLADLKAEVATAKADLAAAKTDVDKAKAELPKQVQAGVSQGVQEGLAACAVPAAQLPTPTPAGQSVPNDRAELEKAMDALTTAQERVELLRKFNAAQAAK